jgi:hypothetical protein
MHSILNPETVVSQFISCTLPKSDWTHEAHLVTCVWHLENYNQLEVIYLLRSRIIKYNIISGGQNTTTSGYHETLTQFYIKKIEHFLRENENINDTFSDKCNKLLESPLADRNYPLKFYTKELLFSLTCRATWVEPDLHNI